MKRYFFLILIVLLSLPAVAQHRMMMEDGPFLAEALEIMDDYWDRAPADLTFEEMNELSMRLSVPAQKNAYVARSAAASWFIPGLGQFRNEEPLLGTAFLLGDIAATVGSLLIFHALLPEDLKIGNLNYYTTPYSNIFDEWTSAFADASFQDVLPYMGLAAGTAVVKVTLSALSAANAKDLAIARIEAGDVTFVPNAGIVTDSLGRIGLGFGWKY
ncbi:MAG: hypothetical protein ACLFP4_00045 [Spirochaetales bacterium]